MLCIDHNLLNIVNFKQCPFYVNLYSILFFFKFKTETYYTLMYDEHAHKSFNCFVY